MTRIANRTTAANNCFCRAGSAIFLIRGAVYLASREEKVLVFGEPDAKPIVYARAPKALSYNLQSVVDVESGLIVHHDIFNEANCSQLLHPTSTGAKRVLDAEEIHMLIDGGYSNAEEVARCERDVITVTAPIKHRAMVSEHFRPTRFACYEVSDTIRCPAGERSDHQETYAQSSDPSPDSRLQGVH